jgi:hypothetical protein
MALLTFSRDAGDFGTALEYAERLSRIAPNDRDVARISGDLRARLQR